MMVSGRLLRGAALVLSALLLPTSPVGTVKGRQAPSGASAEVAYLLRGNAVETSFRQFSQRLGHAHSRLSQLFRSAAHQLYAELKEQAPQQLRSGYQILPEILPDSPPPAKEPGDFFNTYSWPRTERMLELSSARLGELTQKIDQASASADLEAFGHLLSDYKALKKDQTWIENHIRHNRLWQEQIALSPERFRRGTLLYDLARQRQTILDRLGGGDADPSLRDQERRLLAEIREGQSRSWSPAYIREIRQGPGEWEVQVPLYSDIEDEAFLRRFQEIIESYWRYGDDEVNFQLRLSIRRISTADLYRGKGAVRSSGNSAVPSPGGPIDLDRHLSLFPADGAALTTGAEKIHARGRFILLGPEATALPTLAHEFGHVLGFRDEYVRGFRDLGDEGYEILEASPDPDDLMCSSGTGAVQRRHFEQLVSP